MFPIIYHITHFPQLGGKRREMVIWLWLIFPSLLLFLFPVCWMWVQNLGADLALASFPELRDFLISVCLGELHLCVHSASVRQWINSLTVPSSGSFLTISHGQSFNAVLFLCFQKYTNIKMILTQPHSPKTSPNWSVFSEVEPLHRCFHSQSLESSRNGKRGTLQISLGLFWFSVGLEPADMVLIVQRIQSSYALLWKAKTKAKKKKILKGWLFSASKHWRIVIISRGVEGSAFFFPPVLAASAISYFALLLHSPTSFIFWSWLGKPWALWGFCFHAFPFHCLLENKCINWVLGGSAPTLPCREIHITASQNPPVNRSADLNTLFY